jgi:1,4-alpha-glucan branching enzyme
VPGKKLLFMGGEFGAPVEWNHEAELPWPVLGDAEHAGVQGWVRRLNTLYSDLEALHRVDRDPSGFRWIVGDDREQSVLAYLRSADGEDPVLVVMNNTPEPRTGYGLGVDEGTWELMASSDDAGYGGSGYPVVPTCAADGDAMHGFDQSITVDLPPLAILIYRGSNPVS